MTPRPLLPEMLRSCLAASAALLALAGAAGYLVGGTAAAAGAACGVLVVVGFGGSTLVVMRAARDLEPRLLTGVALTLYGSKVGLLLVAAPALRSAAEAAGPAHAWAAGAAAAAVLAWTAALLTAAARARQPVYDDGGAGEPAEQRC